MKESRDKRNRRLERNAEAVGRFWQISREKGYKGTAPGFFNYEADKPESKSPASAWYDRFMGDPDHDVLWQYVVPTIEKIRKNRFPDYRPLLHIENDPGVVRQWEREDAPREDKEMLRAFGYVCMLVAQMVEKQKPGVRIVVHSRPEDLPQPDKPTAAYEDRKRTTKDTNRAIVEELERVQKETGKTGWSSWWELHIQVKDDPNRGWSVHKIRKALEEVRRDRKGDVA